MAKRTYRTASGKMVDMDTLALKNETVIAVGNMNVNARGDKLGQGGKVVQSREELIAEHYRVKNTLIPEERPLNQKQKPEATVDQHKQIDEDPMGPLDEPVVADPVPEEQADEEPAQPVSEPSGNVEQQESTGADSGQDQSGVEVVESSADTEENETSDEWVEDPETGDFVRASELTEKKSDPARPNTRGLAGALAESKSVSVPKIQSAKEKARSKKGVKRL